LVKSNYQVNYQRERAEEAVRYLRGVKGVTNLIQHYCRQSWIYVSSLICANYGIGLQATLHPAPKPVPSHLPIHRERRSDRAPAHPSGIDMVLARHLPSSGHQGYRGRPPSGAKGIRNISLPSRVTII
jgi:hypothetical protein